MGDVSEVGYPVRLPQDVVYTAPVEEEVSQEAQGPENTEMTTEQIEGSEGLGNHIDVTA
ncbi:MAG: hypothetical protein JXQ30_16585 [Spirochaetes bacterium]|nr:hypothetical protein [Spirochaetota bacterium]